jgi:hypothetical protein
MDLLTTYTVLSLIFHNSQITTAPAKAFPACCVFTSRSLVTASNSGDSSASHAQVLSSQLTLSLYFNISEWTLEKHHVSKSNLYCFMRVRCRRNVFTKPLPKNGCCLHSQRLATCLYATIKNDYFSNRMVFVMQTQCVFLRQV